MIIDHLQMRLASGKVSSQSQVFNKFIKFFKTEFEPGFTGFGSHRSVICAIAKTVVIFLTCVIFLKWANRGLFFAYFHSFPTTISIIQIEKSKDVVLGIRTWGSGMVGVNEPWRYGGCPNLWNNFSSVKSFNDLFGCLTWNLTWNVRQILRV